MNENDQIALVINEESRGGSTRPLVREHLYSQLELFQNETRRHVSVVFSRSREHVGKSIASLQSKGYNHFVTYGGDGTINDAIQHMKKDCFLLPISAGNANDFAARLNLRNFSDTLGAFKDAFSILRDLVKQKVNVIGIDLGEVEFSNKNGERMKKRFINNCGIGTTADLVKRLEGKIRKNYALSGLISILSAKPFVINYFSPGLQREISLTCLGAEGLLCRKVGNYAYLAPYKRENNETLHFFLINDMPWLYRVALVVMVRFGIILPKGKLSQYYHDKKEALNTNKFSLSVSDISQIKWGINRITPLHVDGNMVPEFEEALQRDCIIKVLPKFIKTISPC